MWANAGGEFAHRNNSDTKEETSEQSQRVTPKHWRKKQGHAIVNGYKTRLSSEKDVQTYNAYSYVKRALWSS